MNHDRPPPWSLLTFQAFVSIPVRPHTVPSPPSGDTDPKTPVRSFRRQHAPQPTFTCPNYPFPTSYLFNFPVNPARLPFTPFCRSRKTLTYFPSSFGLLVGFGADFNGASLKPSTAAIRNILPPHPCFPPPQSLTFYSHFHRLTVDDSDYKSGRTSPPISLHRSVRAPASRFLERPSAKAVF